jgi:hypothetical protein
MDDNQDSSKRRQPINKTMNEKNNQQLQFLSNNNKGQTQKMGAGANSAMGKF